MRNCTKLSSLFIFYSSSDNSHDLFDNEEYDSDKWEDETGRESLPRYTVNPKINRAQEKEKKKKEKLDQNEDENNDTSIENLLNLLEEEATDGVNESTGPFSLKLDENDDGEKGEESVENKEASLEDLLSLMEKDNEKEHEACTSEPPVEERRKITLKRDKPAVTATTQKTAGVVNSPISKPGAKSR